MKNFINKILDWFRYDGILHLGVCFMLTVILGSFLRIHTAAGIVLIIGILKEAYDNFQPDNKWDWHDILCDIIGIALGAIVWLMYLIF